MNRQDNNQESHFDEYAFDWWNKTGNYKLLHNLNPLRLDYVSSRFEIKSKKDFRYWVWRRNILRRTL